MTQRSHRSVLFTRVAAVLSGGLVAWLGGASVSAQTCPTYQQGDLVEPPALTAVEHVLDTTLQVQMRNQCIPVMDATSGQWSLQSMTLRTYGFPGPATGPLTWTTPGPTFKVRKASTQGATDGDRLRILLVNGLPISSTPDDQCVPACPSGTDCSGSNPPKCCQAELVWPECFHGENTTNLHFHGTHVSPQSPQDYVLLQLMPPGEAQATAHATHSRGTLAVGSFQYDIDPFPWDQAEGTHWYHPHKHGSVAVQVLNGMAGALLIKGPFDDWLEGSFAGQGGLTERLMVIQQLNPSLNFFAQDPNFVPPFPTLNGQGDPIVRMQPGEIQRWRFVGATMQGSAQLEIQFDASLTARQIAQDGVRFAPENYQNQPLLGQGLTSFQISPGNRADFLVQAPQTPGTFFVSQHIIGHLEHALQERVEARDRALARAVFQRLAARNLAASAPAAPPLFTVVVGGAAKSMSFPTPQQWPPMPSYLADLPSGLPQRTVYFSMQGNPGVQPDAFFINGKQFDDSCVDFTLPLGTAEEWTVRNTTDNQSLGIPFPFHVFHIHTNPFQVVANGTTSFQAPYVWWDAIGLPSANGNVPGSVTLRQKWEDYTGEFVLHCHFLGHEDRGMMLGVQTVCAQCPDSSQPCWGKPQVGAPDDCSAGATSPAAPQCAASSSTNN